jgi:hypothetical protein
MYGSTLANTQRWRKILLVGGTQLMQAKLKHMWLRKVDHILIVVSSTMASRKMAAYLALIATFIFIFNFP